MKKLLIVSSLLCMLFVNAAVYADDVLNAVAQDDPMASATNLSSNDTQNPFGGSAVDNAAAAQPDAAQAADDSDSW